MQVVFVMFRGEGDRRSFSVTRDVTVIGRREDCDLRIPVSEVSRKHCRIIRDGDTVRAEDLGSSNGTFHNGQRISGGVILQPGDSIQVGPVVFVLQIDGVPADDELAPFEDRAAHQLDDSLAEHPPLPAVDDSMAAAENLEILEETPDATGPVSMEEESMGLDEEPTDDAPMPVRRASSIELNDEPISLADSAAMPLAHEDEGVSRVQSHDAISLADDDHHPKGDDELATMPRDDEHGAAELDLSDHMEDHHAGEPLSEDDLLLDLNSVEEAPKKH
jgi:pSer/pThr/pTyr-binding forkhead associated (FHA) protein